MSDDKSGKTCVSCGAEDGSGITDKLKFKNRKGGTVFIQYKAEGSSGSLCRKCWQKNIKQFHDKIEKSVKAAG